MPATHSALNGRHGSELAAELTRYATLAPSSHNTQCWKFSAAPGSITILPDFARRCPAVDPDDHHLFVSLSGNPTLPTWLGRRMFDLFFTGRSENEKYARQMRSSAGVAVFVGKTADKANWVEVGRSYQRFALQASALGIRNAMLNQPVEVGHLRTGFASLLGIGAQRPDLVVRFGRGPTLSPSLRRPVQAVMT